MANKYYLKLDNQLIFRKTFTVINNARKEICNTDVEKSIHELKHAIFIKINKLEWIV